MIFAGVGFIEINLPRNRSAASKRMAVNSAADYDGSRAHAGNERHDERSSS